MRTRDILRAARRDGRTAGENRASWAFDGNTDAASYARVLKGLSDGDPMILDQFNPPNLSGEWARYPRQARHTARALRHPHGPAGRHGLG